MHYIARYERCASGGYPWRPGESFERATGLECPGTRPVGPPRSLPDDYPSVVGVIGGVDNRGVDIAPVKSFAVWDQCPRLITEAEVTPFITACLESYRDAGIVYLSQHPLSGVEEGSTGRDGMASIYPGLFSDAVYTHTYGSGTVLVVSDGNIALDYDGSLAPEDLAAFNSALEPVYSSDVTTDFSEDVHIHKWRDQAGGLEVFHLVNFNYDEATDTVLSTNDNTFAFDPSGSYGVTRVTYYTPALPEGESLQVISLASGKLQVTNASLHVYGVVVLQEG